MADIRGVRFPATHIMRISRPERVGEDSFAPKADIGLVLESKRNGDGASQFGSDSGYFMYIVTTTRMTWGEESKQRGGSWVVLGRAILPA